MLHKLTSLLVASSLAVIGVIGLTSSHHGRAVSAAAADPTDQPSALALSNLLAEREITLEQRREAQQLVKDFTLGQMTRHYWGSFAGSLVELGLSPMDEAKTTVRSDAISTRLWIEPRRGDTAYLALVERLENRLSTRYCKGTRDQVLKPFDSDCPASWISIDIPELQR